MTVDEGSDGGLVVGNGLLVAVSDGTAVDVAVSVALVMKVEDGGGNGLAVGKGVLVVSDGRMVGVDVFGGGGVEMLDLSSGGVGSGGCARAVAVGVTS